MRLVDVRRRARNLQTHRHEKADTAEPGVRSPVVAATGPIRRTTPPYRPFCIMILPRRHNLTPRMDHGLPALSASCACIWITSTEHPARGLRRVGGPLEHPIECSGLLPSLEVSHTLPLFPCTGPIIPARFCGSAGPVERPHSCGRSIPVPADPIPDGSRSPGDFSPRSTSLPFPSRFA